MKKVAIVTPYGNTNFGNKLQNYALQTYLTSMGVISITLKNYNYSNTKKKFLLRLLKNKIKLRKKVDQREKLFLKFNKYINYSQKVYTAFSKYTDFDYVIAGSDQIWNPNQGKLREFDVLSNVEPQKRISYAASFGVNNLSSKYDNIVLKEIGKFKNISVREEEGKKIICNLTKRKDVEVLVDPTMLISINDWKKIMKKPQNMNFEKYILIYFLGNISEKRMECIKTFALENNCKIINLLDKNSDYYECGPSEFLYLEKNAFLICTDSFHSSVFAFLFDRPFVIFEREQKELENMSSRLNTLIKKFKLKDRYFNGKKITNENLNHNYSESYIILDEERKKSKDFLKKSLDIENGE